MTDTPILRVAISQCIIFTILLYVFILLGSSLDNNNATEYNISRSALFVISGYLIIPLTFAFLLLLGVLKEKLILVRMWVTATIVNAVALLCILMTGSIRASANTDIFWTIILVAIPILLTIWIFDHIIIVLDSYKKIEQQRKQQSIKTIMAGGISFA